MDNAYEILANRYVDWTTKIRNYFPVLVVFVLTSLSHHPSCHPLLATVGGSFVGLMYNFFSLGYPDMDIGVYKALYFPLLIVRILFHTEIKGFFSSFGQMLVRLILGTALHLFFAGFLCEGITNKTAFETDVVMVVVSGSLFLICDVPVVWMENESVRNLARLIEGDVILTNVMAIYIYTLCILSFESGNTYIFAFVVMSVVSLIFGMALGGLMTFLLRTLHDDSFNAITMVLATSYLAYFVSFIFNGLGCLASTAAVLVISTQRQKLSIEVDNDIRKFIQITFGIVQTLLNIILPIKILSSFDGNFGSVISSIGVFVVCRSVELLKQILMIPLLKCLHYSFNLTSAFNMFWSTTRGPLLYMQIIELALVEDRAEKIRRRYYMHVIVYSILTHISSNASMRGLLGKFDIFQMGTNREHNVSNALSYINMKRVATLAAHKTNRNYSDVNWTYVNDATKIINPYQKSEDDLPTENLFYFSFRKTQCPNCSSNVTVAATPKELKDMARNVRAKLLRAYRVAFIRQYENGFVTKKELNNLLWSIENAFDSDGMLLKIEEPLKISDLVRVRENVYHHLHKYLLMSLARPPKKKWKFVFYKIVTNIFYKLFFYFLNITLCILHLVEVELEYILPVFMFLFLMEIIVGCIGYSYISIGNGIGKYLRNIFRIVDIVALILNVILYAQFLHLKRNYVQINFYELLCLIRFFSLLKIFEFAFPFILKRVEGNRNAKIAFMFSKKQAIICSYDEFIEKMSNLADTNDIKNVVKQRLDDHKLILHEHIGEMETTKPTVTITVKTRKAMTSILFGMKSTVSLLRRSGALDHVEFSKINIEIDDRLRKVASVNVNQILTNRAIFDEILWLENADIREYFHDHISTKLWKAGEVLCEFGKPAECVYVVITGIFKMTYQPSQEVLSELALEGLLPVRDYITNAHFGEGRLDFITRGNSIGELSVMTGRRYSCEIVAYCPCQVLCIPATTIWNAVAEDVDEATGLSCQIWKMIGMNLGKRILLNTPYYSNMSNESMVYVLCRAIFPNLEHFKELSFYGAVQDAVLLYGIVMDANTREIYVAPCFLPRSIQRVLLPKSDQIGIETFVTPKLMIIPIDDVDIEEFIRSKGNITRIEHPTTSKVFVKTKKRKKLKAFGRGDSPSTTNTNTDTLSYRSNISKSIIYASSATSVERSEEAA